jgi:hypothetical protein
VTIRNLLTWLIPAYLVPDGFQPPLFLLAFAAQVKSPDKGRDGYPDADHGQRPGDDSRPYDRDNRRGQKQQSRGAHDTRFGWPERAAIGDSHADRTPDLDRPCGRAARTSAADPFPRHFDRGARRFGYLLTEATFALVIVIILCRGIEPPWVPSEISMAALLVSLISYYAAYLFAAALSLGLLWFYHAASEAMLGVNLKLFTRRCQLKDLDEFVVAQNPVHLSCSPA